VSQVLTPDLDQAQRFLDLLELGGQFWFQTQIEPNPTGRGSPRVLSGTLAQVANQLVALNLAGSAVWVQINAGSSRKDAHVTRVRSYFVDLDHASADPLFASPAPADIIIESSPGKYHGYWLASDVPLDQFTARQHLLADRFNGDHAVCNLGRVMRLPGFIHQKGTPFLSQIVQTRAGL
jgi:hypothetical protein